MLSSIPNINENCRRRLSWLQDIIYGLVWMMISLYPVVLLMLLHWGTPLLFVYVYKHAYNWHNISSLTKQSRFMTSSWPAAANFMKFIHNGSWLHETSSYAHYTHVLHVTYKPSVGKVPVCWVFCSFQITNAFFNVHRRVTEILSMLSF